MVKFANRVKVAITQNSGSWPGTGTVYLGAAAAGYQSIPTSLNGETIRFVLEHGTDWEIGSGTFDSSAQTVTRSLASSSTGSLLDIDGAANIFISPSAEDLQYVEVYSSTSDLPAASSNHGRIAHVHSDGAIYFAHAGNWVRLGNHSDITTYSAATTSADGLLSASDKTKLDGISTSANNYALPTASASALGGIKIGTGLSIDNSGVVTASSSSSSGGSLVPITTTKIEVSSDGETAFTGSWKAENISVFLNGVKLQDSEVTATNTQVTISATAAGDIVEVVEYGAPFASPYASTFPIVTPGETSVTVDYTVDKVAVYKNGVKLRGEGVDFTASNGTTITGFSAFVSGDVVEVVEHGSLASNPNNIVDLSDTPSSLGTAGQILQVNSGANALEFADAGGTGVTVHNNQAAMLYDAASASEGSLHYETANNKLYVKQNSGFFLLASITNTSPTVSGFTETTGGGSASTIADNGTFKLTSGSNTVITLTATDPDLETLVYSATVTNGTASNVISSPSLPISNQSGNTFTLTPVTSGAGGTVTIRFDVSDGNNVVNKTHSFSIAFTIVDSNYTTLLATATNGTSEFYSLSGALYDSITLDTSSESTGYQTFAFNNDGTKLFRISSTIIYQYTLTTGFDLSTGSYDNVSYTIPSNQGSAARAIQFNNDGTKMYVYTSSNTRISQYALTNGFDLSDVSYDNKLYNGTTGNSGFTFNNDGSKLFKATATSKTIETYNLYPHFDISTASDANVSFSTASQTSNTAFQVQFNSNGTKMFVMDWVNSAGNNIYQYTLTQPYVVSSATYDNVSYNYNSQESSPNDFKFNNNGTKMYIGGFATDRIHQYSTVLHGNSNITDSSSNSHSITVNGDAHAGTFSPHRSGGYSLEFNGSNSRVGIQSSNVQLGTSAFTMEFWLYSNDFSPAISSKYSGSGTNGYFLISATSSSGLRCRTRSTGGTQSYVNSGSGTYNLNEWNHCIFQRDANGNLTSYLNGTKYTGDNDGSTDITATELGLGVFNYTGYESWFDGYIRDFKLTIGTSALRTASTITVPTEPLTSDSNTTAFLGHLPYLADGSSSPNSVVSSNASTSPFSPYDYEEYSVTDHGGSVYFDGSGDYLEVTNSTDFVLGTGNFTVECWVYFNTLQVCNIADNRGNGNGFSLQLTGSNYLGIWDETTGTQLHISNSIMTINSWYHICYQRSGTTSKYYINGVQQGSDATHSGNFTSNSMVFGSRWSKDAQYFDGFLSNFRLIKGTAVYNSIVTPPTTPVTDITNTKLIVNGTDASIIDKSQVSNLKLEGNTTGSTTQVKFSNTKSMYFDGTGDYIISQEPVLLGTQDFTVECWLYYQSGLELMGNRLSNGSGGFSVRMTSTSLTVGNSSGTGFGSVFSGTTSSLTNAWHHIAVSRSSGVTKIYVDGSSIASHSSAIDFSLSNPFVIGYSYSNGSGAASIQGYIQDFRVTISKPRYTADDETANIPSAPLGG